LTHASSALVRAHHLLCQFRTFFTELLSAACDSAWHKKTPNESEALVKQPCEFSPDKDTGEKKIINICKMKKDKIHREIKVIFTVL